MYCRPLEVVFCSTVYGWGGGGGAALKVTLKEIAKINTKMRLDFPKLPEGDFLIYTFLIVFLLLKTVVLLYIFVE